VASLFSWGKVRLAGGDESDWKIDCDALSAQDWDCLARLVAARAGPFRVALGVPTGGERLAQALNALRHKDARPVLVVDDVLTTGASMADFRALLRPDLEVRGAVVFARGRCPHWVTPLFVLYSEEEP
jgi:hypothetical protein